MTVDDRTVNAAQRSRFHAACNRIEVSTLASRSKISQRFPWMTLYSSRLHDYCIRNLTLRYIQRQKRQRIAFKRTIVANANEIFEAINGIESCECITPRMRLNYRLCFCQFKVVSLQRPFSYGSMYIIIRHHASLTIKLIVMFLKLKPVLRYRYISEIVDLHRPLARKNGFTILNLFYILFIWLHIHMKQQM